MSLVIAGLVLALALLVGGGESGRHTPNPCALARQKAPLV
jgi:hypothetical protein